MTVIPVTYGYARVSKTDDESRNLETQLPELAAHGIRQDLIFTDTASGRTMDRNGWKNLMARVQPEDTVVVAFLDRFSRNFEEGVAIQADLTKRDIAIVALRKQIDTREDSAAAKFFRRAMLAQGPTKWSRPARAFAWGWRGPGRWQEHRPAPVPECERVEQCRRMAEERASKQQIARVLSCSPSTVKKALASLEAGMELQC